MTRRPAAPPDAQHLTDRARRVRTKKAVDSADVTALHRLAGADDPLPEWQLSAAARYVTRHGGDTAGLLLDILGLAQPASDGESEPVAEPTKRCPACEQTLPLDAFTRNAAKKHGRSVYCRACFNTIRKKWRTKQ